METTKNYTFKLFVAAVAGLIVGYFVFNGGDNSSAGTGSNIGDKYIGVSLKDSPTIACTFERTTAVAYEKNAIVHEMPHKEANPIVFIFSALNTESPKVQGVGSNNTLYDSNAVILGNTADKLILGEVTPTEKNVFIYTIHKASGVATWTKQYEIFGTPLGLISMGKCSASY